MNPTVDNKKIKPAAKGRSHKKPEVAKYHGVALPADATQRRRLRNKLSAQVHRKRKQDALDTAKQEVEGCDVVVDKLKVQLDDTRTKISSLQSVMDAIKAEFGEQAVQHIFQQCKRQTGGEIQLRMESSSLRQVVSSDSSTASDDETHVFSI